MTPNEGHLFASQSLSGVGSVPDTVSIPEGGQILVPTPPAMYPLQISDLTRATSLCQFGRAPLQEWPYHSTRIDIQPTMRS